MKWLLTGTELRRPLVLAITTMVDVVTNEVLVDANPIFTLESISTSSTFVFESCDHKAEAILVGSPRVRDVFQRDEVGTRVDDTTGAEGVDCFFARQIGLETKTCNLRKTRTEGLERKLQTQFRSSRAQTDLSTSVRNRYNYRCQNSSLEVSRILQSGRVCIQGIDLNVGNLALQRSGFPLAGKLKFVIVNGTRRAFYLVR